MPCDTRQPLMCIAVEWWKCKFCALTSPVNCSDCGLVSHSSRIVVRIWIFWNPIHYKSISLRLKFIWERPKQIDDLKSNHTVLIHTQSIHPNCASTKTLGHLITCFQRRPNIIIIHIKVQWKLCRSLKRNNIVIMEDAQNYRNYFFRCIQKICGCDYRTFGATIAVVVISCFLVCLLSRSNLPITVAA